MRKCNLLVGAAVVLGILVIPLWCAATKRSDFSNTPHFANPGANVSNMVLNPDGTVKNLAGFSQILSTIVTGRTLDERQFRFGLKASF